MFYLVRLKVSARFARKYYLLNLGGADSQQVPPDGTLSQFLN